MAHLVPIRGDVLPGTLVLVREGVTTLSDTALHQACERARELMGIQGFSVLEVPGGDYEMLARLRPLLKTRRPIMTMIRTLFSDPVPNPAYVPKAD